MPNSHQRNQNGVHLRKIRMFTLSMNNLIHHQVVINTHNSRTGEETFIQSFGDVDSAQYGLVNDTDT
jgi:hypothetical protein